MSAQEMVTMGKRSGPRESALADRIAAGLADPIGADERMIAADLFGFERPSFRTAKESHTGVTSPVRSSASASAEPSSRITDHNSWSGGERTATTVIVYIKPACVQTNATLRSLDKLGIEYQTVDVSKDAAAMDRIRALGYVEPPVVVAGDDHWSGFRPDKIQALAEHTPAELWSRSAWG